MIDRSNLEIRSYTSVTVPLNIGAYKNTDRIAPKLAFVLVVLFVFLVFSEECP